MTVQTLRGAAAREAAWRALATATFDILVIGGGITGAGVARDAALRGLRVAMVERADFASGTSSRSSRLVHGGLRYLEHGYLGLVFESSRERRTLLRIAPHLVHPLRFVWPVYQGARVKRWKLLAGLTLYDTLALFQNVENHRPLGARGVLAHEPALRHERLVGGARYFDAATDDSRLTLANALAAREAGAVVLNHAAVTALGSTPQPAGHERTPREATVRDALSGDSLVVRARVIVNATGPWSDETRRLAHGGALTGLRGTRGSHIAVPRERVGNVEAVTMLSAVDGRVMFVLPDGPRTIIGTTDTATTVSPDEIRATEADVAYLLRSANEFFPAAQLERADVVAAWAGLRPLVAAGFRDGESSASREHAIAASAPGFITVSGGKLTTYRSMAAETVDAALRALAGAGGGHALARASDDSSGLPLPGGELRSIESELASAYGEIADHKAAARLVHAFGSRWRAVWALTAASPELAGPLVAGHPQIAAEVVYAARHEMAQTVGDVLIRRTRLAFELHDNGLEAAGRVAELMARELGWDAATRRARADGYRAERARVFTVDPG